MWWDGCKALKSMRSGRWAWIRALNPRPLRHEPAHTQSNQYIKITPRVQIYVYNKFPDVIPVKSWMLTPGYPLVLRWHHSSSASFADFFSLLSFSSSCQHTQYVHCHDLRNRTTKYHLNMYAHTHTPGSVSRTCTFAKPPLYTLNPKSKTCELAFIWNIWGYSNEIWYILKTNEDRLQLASVGTASNQHRLEVGAKCDKFGSELKNDKLH